jgi:hypothetical protein
MNRVDDGVTKEAVKALLFSGAVVVFFVCLFLFVGIKFLLPWGLGWLDSNVQVNYHGTILNWTEMNPFQRGGGE